MTDRDVMLQWLQATLRSVIELLDIAAGIAAHADAGTTPSVIADIRDGVEQLADDVPLST